MSTVTGRYWHQVEDGRLQCDLCPRFCRLRDGQHGLCFVRAREGDTMVLTTYGRSSGFCVDPTCRFCQNWSISKSREVDTLADAASPETIARAARSLGCTSVAFTYNDPVIFLEYAVDVAQACREQGIRTVAVTAGEICAEPRQEFFAAMDAANVDLKGFTERFYHDICGGSLAAVLETLQYLRHETDVWFEITNLIIPGENDADAELEGMTAWIVEHLGSDVPVHFTAFHPDYRMLDRPPTPPETLSRARRIARANGLHHAYTGNVHDEDGGSTTCTGCGQRLIGRDWYVLTHWGLDETGACTECGTRLAGHFDGPPGTWGAKRQPVRLADFDTED